MGAGDTRAGFRGGAATLGGEHAGAAFGQTPAPVIVTLDLHLSRKPPPATKPKIGRGGQRRAATSKPSSANMWRRMRGGLRAARAAVPADRGATLSGEGTGSLSACVLCVEANQSGAVVSIPGQSALMFAALATAVQRAMSAATTFANASPGIAEGSTPSPLRRSRTSGSAMTRAISA